MESIKKAIIFLKTQGYKILKQSKSMQKHTGKHEKKRVNKTKRFGGSPKNANLIAQMNSVMNIVSGAKLHPNFYTTTHTKETYRSQQRKAVKRRRSKVAA